MSSKFSSYSETGPEPDFSSANSSTSTPRKPRGKPFEPGNQQGRGRPPGSRNKKTLLLQELLDEYGKVVVQRVIKKAADGDRTAMKLVFERVLPVMQENRMEMDLPELRNAADLTMASAALIQALANGEVTVEQSRAMAELLQCHRNLFVSGEIERRVAALERGRSPSGAAPALQIIELQTIEPTENPKTEAAAEPDREPDSAVSPEGTDAR